jgi:ATP-dependent 26S proteasome regulatory subunit
MGQQKHIIDVIIEDYMKRRHTVAFIYGKPGTGKSMIGILIANRFSSSFCNTIYPWQPGDTLGCLVTEVEPTAQKPLILVFDEIDLTLMKIHEGIPQHKNVPIVVSDKSGWNHMLDSIQRGMYPNIILIMTSNRGPEFINSLDTSYIRKGRVDIIEEMTESLIE